MSQVGIVGMGRIGARVAKRLHGFDCTVLYPGAPPSNLPCDSAYFVLVHFEVEAQHSCSSHLVLPDRRDVPEVRGIATMVPLDELYARSDFVIVLTPLTDSTRGMINMDVFKCDPMFFPQSSLSK